MKRFSHVSSMICTVIGLGAAAIVRSAVPFPDASTPKAIDVGRLADQAPNREMSVTLALGLRDVPAAEKFLTALHTPGDPQFQQFLTPDQFVARFGPLEADVAKASAFLGQLGLTVEKTSATTLKVSGSAAALEHAFSVNLHGYAVPAHGNAPGYTFHAPTGRPTIPSTIASSVVAVAGLDSEPRLRPHFRKAPLGMRTRARPVAPQVGAATANAPGSLTVSDFASLYDVTPLYTSGISGKGRTLGILTFAALTPSDAFSYWSALGVSVDPHRLRIVNVDGGPGAPSDASGSIETTIDVEQSGGVAPGSNIIVYQGSNSNQAFVDVLAAAVEANTAQSLSISWGFWEWYQNLENAPVTDPLTGKTVGITQAFHELLLRAGIQGQSVFAAAGDGGAYDINNDYQCFPPGAVSSPTDTCSLTLSVDYPASDPAITAGGGTTLPGLQQLCLNAACTPPLYDVNIAHESVWGWDYLNGFCAAQALTPYTCGTFPAGGGGGVSVIFPLPAYQQGLPGIQSSQPNQAWILDGVLTYALPARFNGRNVPDVSFNADPDTGYVTYYTSDISGFGIESDLGGTSFVGPQLNGVTALLGQYLNGQRLGLLNYPLYRLATAGVGRSPLTPVAYGDNWFYHGSHGYNLGAGLGTLDVAAFAKALK
jgi:subtilase family serine protease